MKTSRISPKQAHYFKNIFGRITAIFVISAIFFPTLMIQKVQGSMFKVQSSTYKAESPEPFFVESSQSFVLSPSVFVASILNFFSSAKTIEGFENSKNQIEYSANSATLSSSNSETSFDFDGDGKADLARWQRATGEWKVKKSSDNQIILTSLGTSTSTISPGKFDSDSITDYAVFDAGTWTIKQSSTNTTITISGFGSAGDKPVIGDYDGDGLADLAVYRPSNGTWYIKQSSTNTVTSTQFGTTGDIPVAGNYDGNSTTDIAVFRPSTGDWHMLLNGNYSVFHWGISSDIPVPADFDGDGKTDFAVFRGTTGTWYAAKSSTNNADYFAQTWGNYGDQPAPADYDGDGKADFTVWRPTTGTWHSIKSSDLTYTYKTLGISGDTAVESAYIKQIGSQVSAFDLAKARLSAINETGGTNLYSRNFGWGTGLAGLSGRGLSAGFGMSYNSLIWTKQGNNIFFDADNSNISPGFRFGFPTIEPSYFDTATGKFAFLMVSPSGNRTEFRQIGASNTYETADSSYTQLKFKGANTPNSVEDLEITVTGTDGTAMNFAWIAGAYRASKITDANGNFITIFHDEYGLLRTVTDTLNRVITVDYDAQFYPTTVTQTWQNGVHNYATFSYTNKEITTNFDTNLNIFGPISGTTIKVLDKVTFADNSFVKFDYNGYGQVEQVNNHAADGHKLNHVATNLNAINGTQTDCPRFSETRSWVENFNKINNVEQEVVIPNEFQTNQTYTLPNGGTATGNLIQITTPDGNGNSIVSKTYTGNSGWQEGLPIATEDWVAGTKKRWTWTDYTQDNTSLSYVQNPRVIESKIGDTENGNVRRTTNTYWSAAEYNLPKETFVYDIDQTTVLKKSYTEYNLATTYTTRRIIGLPSKTESYGLENGVLSMVNKTTYAYDEGDFNDATLEQTITPINHDTTKYGANFVIGRGNLTSVTRWDVTGVLPNVTSSVKYNIAGSPVASIDPLNRTVKTSYTDSFADGINRNTFAYPTKLTDPAGNFSQVKYRFDIGANVWAKSPTVDGNAANSGKETSREFDTIGRPTKETLVNTGAYTRYEYPTNGVQSKVFTTITDTNNNGTGDSADEVLSESWADGAGRTRKSRTEHPNSVGGYSGSLVEYNILGQVKRSSVATEIGADWNPAGDDATRGWLWTEHEYDWKGRPTREINTDGTDKLFSYNGCGCAGGQVTTIQGEEIVEKDWQGQITQTLGRRTRKVYTDIIGREYKNEIFNWDNSVYSSIVTTFDGNDKPRTVKQFDGTDSQNNTHQITTFSYDGHGRLSAEHIPQQDANKYTTYSYFADDKIQTRTDARGATTHHFYTSLGQLETMSYSVLSNSNIMVPSPTTYTYDNLGNRKTIVDGSGTLTYSYNNLSQLISETKVFNGLSSSSFTLSYQYSISGKLSKFTNADGTATNYNFDKIGRLENAVGEGYFHLSTPVNQLINDIRYTAFGAVKTASYQNGSQFQVTFNNKLLPEEYKILGKMEKTYSYQADGKIEKSHDLIDYRNDRRFFYDQVGRNTKAIAGVEARGTALPNEYAWNPIYRRQFIYNSFDNPTNKAYWADHTNNFEPQYSVNQTYSNNRINTWDYDIDGRLVASKSYWGTTDTSFKYDASGSAYEVKQGGIGLDGYNKKTTVYDGNGHVASENMATGLNNYDSNGSVISDGNGNPVLTEFNYSRYFLTSTVLGGAIVHGISPHYSNASIGVILSTSVYADGNKLAFITNPNAPYVRSFNWHIKDSLGFSTYYTNLDTEIPINDSRCILGNCNQIESDPEGNIVERIYNWGYGGGGSGSSLRIGESGGGYDNFTCDLDHVLISCGQLEDLDYAGATEIEGQQEEMEERVAQWGVSILTYTGIETLDSPLQNQNKNRDSYASLEKKYGLKGTIPKSVKDDSPNNKPKKCPNGTVSTPDATGEHQCVGVGENIVQVGGDDDETPGQVILRGIRERRAKEPVTTTYELISNKISTRPLLSSDGKPNCFLNMLVFPDGSTGSTIGRNFYNGHDGRHAVGRKGVRANVNALPSMSGDVVLRTGDGSTEQGGIVDVWLDNSDYVAIFKDVVINPKLGERLEGGELVGITSTKGEAASGFHFTLVNKSVYGKRNEKIKNRNPYPSNTYRSYTWDMTNLNGPGGLAASNARQGLFDKGLVIDPLSKNSPFNCPGVGPISISGPGSPLENNPL